MSTRFFDRSVSETGTRHQERKTRRADKRGSKRRERMALARMRLAPDDFADWTDGRGKRDYRYTLIRSGPIMGFLKSRVGLPFDRVMSEIRDRVRRPQFRFYLGCLARASNQMDGHIAFRNGLEFLVDEDGLIRMADRKPYRDNPDVPQGDIDRWSGDRLVFMAEDGLRWADRYEYSYSYDSAKRTMWYVGHAYTPGLKLAPREIRFWERLTDGQRGKLTCRDYWFRQPEQAA